MFDIAEDFEWHGWCTLSEFGFMVVPFATLHCELKSDVRYDCKKFKVSITDLMGGVALGPALSAVMFPADFYGAIEPEDFQGLGAIVSAGGAIAIGGGVSIIMLGSAVSHSIGPEIGVDLTLVAGLVGGTIDYSGGEIPCKDW